MQGPCEVVLGVSIVLPGSPCIACPMAQRIEEHLCSPSSVSSRSQTFFDDADHILELGNMIKGSLVGETSVLRTFRMSKKELVKERVSQRKS